MITSANSPNARNEVNPDNLSIWNFLKEPSHGTLPLNYNCGLNSNVKGG
jgi:hypothetical protein